MRAMSSPSARAGDHVFEKSAGCLGFDQGIAGPAMHWRVVAPSPTLPTFLSFLGAFLSFATTIRIILDSARLVEVSKKLVSSFVSVTRQSRLRDLADIVMKKRFLPLRENNSPLRSFVNWPFVNGHL